ncbi:MAG: amidohydrolase [Burkholderiaceae bacterium]
MSRPNKLPWSELTIYTARRIITMDESLPDATAVAVSMGHIVAVGTLESMAPWREGRTVTVDERFADKVLMPGLIDNHVHPFLGAILLPTEIIAPEPWLMPDGSVCPAANSPHEYLERLRARLAAKPDTDDWFISWGYQPSEHGHLFRAELDALCPDRPVILWQRSFHETYLNSCAIDKLGIDHAQAHAHPQIDLDSGHFYETGNKVVTARLMPYFLREQWYHKGLGMLASLMHQGGITTAGDMLFGAMGVDFELDAIDAVIEKPNRPLRIVNIADGRGFANRAVGKGMGPPDECPPFEMAVAAIEALPERATRRVSFSRSVKLFADGAMFSQLMQMRAPGYMDGHHGEWLMSPEVLRKGVHAFWHHDFNIHVHVNGDAGMDAVLQALEAAQRELPRFDHRFVVHHVGFHSNAQSRRLAALGAHASVNPFYIHALAGSYAAQGLGPERASQIVRAGSMLRNGMRVSFHSDFPMAPTEPLFLAWCAATRTTRGGTVVAPHECLTLEQALRGITIDAAFALRLDDEIGSIVAGKRADFTVLEDDPFTLGAERLREVRVAGTVIDGEVHMLPSPRASLHAARASLPASTQSRGAGLFTRLGLAMRRGGSRYRPLVALCCGVAGDHCATVRDLALQARRWLDGQRQETGPAAR